MLKNTSKGLILIICTVFILIAAATGTTLAYIFDGTPSIENSFEPVYVSVEVTSDTVGEARVGYKVKNTGDIDAYVRATVVVMWMADDGSVLGTAPLLDTDYTVTLNSLRWQKGSDGFYYYSSPLTPGASTEIFIDEVTLIGEAPAGYSLYVHVAASGIQTDPARVVAETWYVTVADDGTLIPPR